MNNKHRKILRAIFTDPIPVDILWVDVVRLLESLGAIISQGRGSRVRILLRGQRAVFHEPHPERVMDKGAVKSMREFLLNVGITRDSE